MTLDSWWDNTFPFRIPVNISSLRTITSTHPVTVAIPLSVAINLGKMRSDFADLNALFYDADNDTWILLPVYISNDGVNLTVTFDTVEALNQRSVDQYFIYHGNLSSAVASTYTPSDWPILIPAYSEFVSYTRPGEHWRDGFSSTAGAVATMQFYGSQVQIISDVGEYGIMEVSIDGGAWTKVDLFAVDEASSIPVFTQYGLARHLHTIRVRCTGELNPSSGSDVINIQSFEYKSFIDVDAFKEEFAPQLFWTSVLLAGSS